MIDDKELLEGAARQFSPDDGFLKRVHRRHALKQRNRRIGAGVVALLLTLVTFLGLVHAFRSDNRPASKPTSAPTRVAAWFDAARGRIVVAGMYVAAGHAKTGLVAIDPSGRATPAILPGDRGVPLGFSRDGRRLLLTDLEGTRDLVVLDSDGRMISVRARGIGWFAAALSPDGSSIVTAGRSGLRIYPVSGGSPQLLPGTSSASSASWSPDGTKIAYVIRSGRQWMIWVVNSDGSGRRMIVKLPGSRHLWEVGTPAWSPDGARLAFAEDACVKDCNSILVVNADGTGLRRITRRGTSWAPSWSPDGSRIAFLRGLGVDTMNPDGSGLEEFPDVGVNTLPVLVWNSSR